MATYNGIFQVYLHVSAVSECQTWDSYLKNVTSNSYLTKNGPDTVLLQLQLLKNFESYSYSYSMKKLLQITVTVASYKCNSLPPRSA